ncbi:hypothetical protein LOTGIDRAFT_229077 [Lottia gigantea]|uniref:Sugar phosphate transporter domain-containing protein n=1 Tax=Lottia gigantea TaxID=225164 RepID=V3ZXP6_LOTGI|nr:hypothetical protein LOTGIDRAFT_229077 [Lottia gigantea]ESO89177.1 hypothetical protein LOTGIDRAFT_229077 [Lottia gigantea]
MAEKKEVRIEITSESINNVSTSIKAVSAAAFYGCCSVATAFISKTLMYTYEFDYPVIVMVAQMIFTIILLEFLKLIDMIDLPQYTIKRGRSFFWPAFFYGMNALLALSALSHMNIAMYGVLKRCVPISTMVLSYFLLKRQLPSKLTVGSVLCLSLGCFIAGYGDLSFNPVAYFCGALSNFTQAIYLILVQKFSEENMTTAQTLQLNSYNTLPLLLMFSFINQEMFKVWDYPYFGDFRFILLFFLTISIGCVLNYSLFLCAGLTSALTTSVVGGLKALAQTMIGLVTFGGISHNLPTYIGIGMNLSGGIFYIFSKYQDGKKRSCDTKKIISMSTAKDLKEISKGHVSNGNVVHETNGNLITIEHSSKS